MIENHKDFPTGAKKLATKMKDKYGLETVFNNREIKISEVLIMMINPLIDLSMNYEEEKNVIAVGVMSWNLGIIKILKGEEEVEKELKKIEKTLEKEATDIIKRYAEIKSTEYRQYNQFITGFELIEKKATRIRLDKVNLQDNSKVLNLSNFEILAHLNCPTLNG